MNNKNIFVLLGFLLMLILLFHHRYIHNLDASKTQMQKWFQWEDINNHETIILLILGLITGIIIVKYL